MDSSSSRIFFAILLLGAAMGVACDGLPGGDTSAETAVFSHR
jgi:hypothetical protein